MHPALKIPDDIDTLRYSILDIVKMFTDEAPLYLMHSFGLTLKPSEILLSLFENGKAGLDHKALTAKYGRSVENSLSQMRKKASLHDASIEILGRTIKSLDAAGTHAIAEALQPFYDINRRICDLFGVRPTAKNYIPHLTENDLPADKAQLREILVTLMEMLRGNLEEPPLCAQPFRNGKKIILGTCLQALRQGWDKVPTARLAMAICPPFISPLNTTPSEMAVIVYHQLRQNLGCKDTKEFKKTMLTINPEIRAVLGYGKTPITPAPPARPEGHPAVRHPRAAHRPDPAA